MVLITLLERFNELRREYNAYKKKIDNILSSTQSAFSSMENAFDEFKKTNKELQESIVKLNLQLDLLDNDYNQLKKKIEKSFIYKYFM